MEFGKEEDFKFNNIDSIYNFLEKECKKITYEHEIIKQLIDIREKFKKNGNLEEITIMQFEIDFLSFILDGCFIKPLISTPDKEENLDQYPDINKFDNKTFNYLYKRLENTKNPFLKVRYSQILWNSCKKHKNYAKISIESYFELIKLYEKEKLDENNWLEFSEIIRNVLCLSKQINYKLEEIKSKIIDLIKNSNFEEHSFNLSIRLINLMLFNKKIFKKVDFQGIDKIICRIAKYFINKENFIVAKDIFALGERVEIKLGTKNINWKEKIAECYENLMLQAEKSNNQFAASFFCIKAISTYKEIGNNMKVESLSNKNNEIKKSIKWIKFEEKIDITDYIKYYKDISKSISKKEPDKIISILIYWEELLPKYNNLKEEAKKNYDKYLGLKLFDSAFFDKNYNLSRKFSEEKEKIYFQILQNYKFELEIKKINLINLIFYNSIVSEKLSFNTVMDYFKKNSWFGKNIKKIYNDKEIVYNWLNRLAPSIYYYFEQMKYYIINTNYSPNMVLCIDSLSLKIEGLVRDFCWLIGAQTIKIKKDYMDREIEEEKTLEELLYEEKIKQYFNEDDLFFFRFLLTENAGYNLRNKVSHSLLSFEEYSVSYMNLLLLTLLKIGKYDFDFDKQ